MSVISKQTVDHLDDLAEELTKMQLRSDKAEENLIAAAERGEELPISLRNDLGQLHGDANRMMATKLDAIVTMELNSGKQEARTTRKALIKSTEALIERVEGQVKRLDKMREAERSTSSSA